jgi:hypothetical protein
MGTWGGGGVDELVGNRMNGCGTIMMWMRNVKPECLWWSKSLWRGTKSACECFCWHLCRWQDRL